MVTKSTGKAGNKQNLIRGPWNLEEDTKLKEYLTAHPKGKWKWTNIPTLTGINRCPKSCRLRWMNYLRPGLKFGNISEDEEYLIMRLQNLIGNRWALIARRLPGRTDNEIKNYWFTHLKKRALTIRELNLEQSVQKNLTDDSSYTFVNNNPTGTISMFENSYNDWLDEVLCDPYEANYREATNDRTWLQCN